MSASAAPPAPKSGVVEDFVDIFATPSAVFERRRDSSPWLPLVIVSVVLAAAYLASSGAMQPIMDAEYERGMRATLEANPQLTAEQLQQGRAIAQGVGKFFIIASTPITIFLTGLVLLLTGKMVDAEVKLGTSVMIAAWAFVPRIIGSLATAAQLLILRPESLDGMYRVSLGPARFMDPDTASPMLLAIAGRLDLFVLWTTVLLGIGLSVVARIPRSSAMVAAGAVWVLASLPALYGALR
jgi:hypothetical protein